MLAEAAYNFFLFLAGKAHSANITLYLLSTYSHCDLGCLHWQLTSYAHCQISGDNICLSMILTPESVTFANIVKILRQTWVDGLLVSIFDVCKRHCKTEGFCIQFLVSVACPLIVYNHNVLERDRKSVV